MSSLSVKVAMFSGSEIQYFIFLGISRGICNSLWSGVNGIGGFAVEMPNVAKNWR